METVQMRSPSGEVKLVEPTPEILIPLMVEGWTQMVEQPAPVPAPVEVKETNDVN